jgi:chorismate mutase
LSSSPDFGGFSFFSVTFVFCFVILIYLGHRRNFEKKKIIKMDELEKYREQINALDRQLIDLFAKRFDIVRAVGKLKADKGIAVVQSERVVEVTERAVQMGLEKNLDENFIRGLYTAMIDLAHVMEHEIVEQHDQSA